MKLRVLLPSLLLAATGCSTGQVGQLPAASGTDPSTFRLGFAVGTARIAADPSANIPAAVGLNVVATFRAPGGQVATLANTPTLSGPANFGTNPDGSPNSNALSGALPTDVLAAASSSHPGPPPDAFGSLIGVFGYGFAPLNLVDPVSNSAVYSGGCDGDFTQATGAWASIRYDALRLPLYVPAGLPGSSCTSPYVQFAWYGGPPAWPSPLGYGMPQPSPGQIFYGYPFGFMDFYNVAPVPGQYGLSVQWLNNAAGTQYDYAQTVATLSSTAALPIMPTPALTINSDGSGTVVLTVPPGVKETIVDIETTLCYESLALPAGTPHYYSLLTTQAGTQSLTLTNNLGPPDANGNPTHTFCTASDLTAPGHTTSTLNYTIAAVGFDYPAYEASYPQSSSILPVISNAAGQADITVSAPSAQITYTPNAALRTRHR